MAHHRITTIVLAAIFLAGCQVTAPHECQVVTARTFQVVRVVDGDTFKVMYDGELTSVRFFGIDAPETREPAGPAATAAMVELVGGKKVRLEFPAKRKRDNFGRLLCKVYVGSLDVGAEMIRRGQATVYVARR